MSIDIEAIIGKVNDLARIVKLREEELERALEEIAELKERLTELEVARYQAELPW